jgi:eukaryotic-like serine/threonine-protein kinase
MLSRHVPAHSPAGENEIFAMSKDQEIAGYPRQLASHLELRRVLGEGGTSIVFEAFHTRLKVPVAVKLLSVRGAIAEQARVRLLREAELYALLDDPRIPRVYDVDALPDGTPYVVMEFVPGRSLEALLSHGPLSPRRAVTIAQEVLAALVYVHARGVLHRDVKPANVILHESGDKCQVRLVDFGIAKAFADAPEQGTRLTQQGTLVGTPHYMAPERLLGEESDASADTYAVGVMLYEMLSGRAPFVGPTLGEVIAAVLRDTPPPLSGLCPHVSAPLIEIVRCAMERDPRARYSSAEGMLRALNQIDSTLQGEISSPRIVPPVRSVAPPSVRAPASLNVDDDDEFYREVVRGRGRWQMPLLVAGGLALLAWSAWPSAVNEREELDTPYMASDGQPSPPPAQKAPAAVAPSQPNEAAPELQRAGDPLVANAPLAGEPMQGAAPIEGSGEALPEVDPASSAAGETGEGVPSALDLDPLGTAETADPAQLESANTASSARAKHAPREPETGASAAAPSYEPVRAVPLQPLLDRIDSILREPRPLPPVSLPSAAPAIEPAPSSDRPITPTRRAREPLPDNPY